MRTCSGIEKYSKILENSSDGRDVLKCAKELLSCGDTINASSSMKRSLNQVQGKRHARAANDTCTQRTKAMHSTYLLHCRALWLAGKIHRVSKYSHTGI